MTSLRLLQVFLGVLSTIPLVSGLPPMWRGLPRAFAADPGFPRLDSEHRYRAAVWSAFGVGLMVMIPSIAQQTLMLRFMMAAIFAGGLARLWSLKRGGYAVKAWLVSPLIAELVVAPLVVVWQAHVSVA